MNFDEVNKVSDFSRDKLFPLWTNKSAVADFGTYLSLISEEPECQWMEAETRVLPITYYVDPVKFSEEYKSKCVTFLATPSPQEGAFHVIYQMSHTLHILARLFHWIDQEEVKAYFMLTAVYKSLPEFTKFFDANKKFRMTGDSSKKVVGFNEEPQSLNSSEDLTKLFNPNGD